ncbi:MAG: transcriptional repressor LexA, partial [Bacteroidota bacterium]
MPTLTQKQKLILDYIKEYNRKHGVSPTFEEIGKHIGKAFSTVHEHVRALIKKGYVIKNANDPRGIELHDNKKSTIDIPILGTIAAGQPIEEITVPNGTVTLTRDEIGKTGKHFALRVVGNSMIDEGIFDGDTVVIRQQTTADNGQTVVAIIDEGNATLKKFYREHDRIRLQPANPTLFPFYRTEVEIRGIVVKIMRNLAIQPETSTQKNEKYTRRIDYSWDFRGEKMKPYTHG